MATAGFHDPRKLEAKPDTRPPLQTLSEKETRAAALTVIDQIQDWTATRRQNARAAVTRYMDGESVKAVARALDLSPGTVSDHISAVARLAGCEIIRRQPMNTTPAEVKGHAIAEREPGKPRKRRASLRGWHSFRTTWITLALANGLPMEIVRRVTGHTTVDVVLKHYFRPDRESFRTALYAALPNGLTGAVSESNLKAEKMVSLKNALRIVDNAKTLREARAKMRTLDAMSDA
jgi:transposase